MKKSEKPKDTRWADVKGYEGIYVVNRDGQFGKINGNSLHISSGYVHNRRHYVAIKLESPDGHRKEFKVARVVWETFNGPIPKGMSIYHIDGMFTNNNLFNLGMMSKKDLGMKTGQKGRAKIVMKVDTDGECVEIYKSAREAARKNFMSYQTVLDRCNHKVQKPFDLDGFNYLFETDVIGCMD